MLIICLDLLVDSIIIFCNENCNWYQTLQAHAEPTVVIQSSPHVYTFDWWSL